MVALSNRLGTTVLALMLVACAPPSTGGQPAAQVAAGIDNEQLIADVRTLAHDSMEGRRPGTPGGERARTYLRARFEELGVVPVGHDGFEHPFDFTPRGGDSQLRGVNFVGMVRGTTHADRYIVVTAHYDHLGIRDGEIYNGADDNASGTGALLGLARYFAGAPPEHSIVFVAFDAEEMGLQGARAFVDAPPVPRQQILLNVNMDMISRNENDELYAVGTWHYPWLRPAIEAATADAPVTVRFGHDSPDLPPGDDWTLASDHGPFHQAGIPFIYFGVEDHPDYHQPTDTFENIDPDFYVRAVETIRRVLRSLDADMPVPTDA
jgi:hypothetical protein